MRLNPAGSTRIRRDRSPFRPLAGTPFRRRPSRPVPVKGTPSRAEDHGEPAPRGSARRLRGRTPWEGRDKTRVTPAFGPAPTAPAGAAAPSPRPSRARRLLRLNRSLAAKMIVPVALVGMGSSFLTIDRVSRLEDKESEAPRPRPRPRAGQRGTSSAPSSPGADGLQRAVAVLAETPGVGRLLIAAGEPPAVVASADPAEVGARISGPGSSEAEVGVAGDGDDSDAGLAAGDARRSNRGRGAGPPRRAGPRRRAFRARGAPRIARLPARRQGGCRHRRCRRPAVLHARRADGALRRGDGRVPRRRAATGQPDPARRAVPTERRGGAHAWRCRATVSASWPGRSTRRSTVSSSASAGSVLWSSAAPT